MTRRALQRFLISVLAASVAAHLLIAVLVTAGLYAVYPQRIFNVHVWSENRVANYRLVGTYLKANARSTKGPVIVFAGSSVSYGDVWPAEVTFPYLLAERRRSATVLNASIIAGDVSAINDWIVCGARRNQIRVDALVIEVPVVNALSHLSNHQREGSRIPPLATCDTSDPDPDYVGFALRTFRGTGWLRILWNRQRQLRGERHIQIAPVPKRYFTSAADFGAVSSLFADQITRTLKNAQAAADVVYAFPSPVFTPGLRRVGEDAAAVEEQLRAALAACRSVPGIRCIDPSKLTGDASYFYNFTHLNHAGHRAMADLLHTQVAP